MSHAPGSAGPSPGWRPLAYGLFVAGITVISRSETRGENRRGLIAGLTLQNLALLGLRPSAMAHRRFPDPAPDRPLIPLEGLLVLALVAMVLNSAASAAIEQPTPGPSRKPSRRASSAWSGSTSDWSPPSRYRARGARRRALVPGIHPRPLALST